MSINKAQRTLGLGIRIAVALAVIAFTLVPPALAESKRAVVIFDTWVEVPGGVLPGGSYIFEVKNTSSTEHKVAIYDRVTGIYIATVPTVPIERSASVSEESIRFEERPYPNPEAVKAWFRPGSRTGEQFVYPANEGLLAQMARPPAVVTPVSVAVATPGAVAERPATNSDRDAAIAATAVEETPAATPTRSADVTTPDAGLPQTTTPLQASPPVTATAPAEAATTTPAESPIETPNSLPKTASPIALITVSGALALMLAGILRFSRQRTSA